MTTPRPHGIAPPNFWQKSIDAIKSGIDEALDFLFSGIAPFFTENFREITIFIAVAIVIFAIWKKLKNKSETIKKLWNFTLFFSEKRQMILPLIYTLGSRHGRLDPAELAQILEARKQVAKLDFRKNPSKRMKFERKISKMLAKFFENLEKSGKIPPDSRWSRVAGDLEFVDRKLVELQKVYNHEVATWNKMWTSWKKIPLAPWRIFGFKKFQKF